MVCALPGFQIERSGFERWPGSLCCVLALGNGELLGKPDEMLGPDNLR